MSVSLSDDNTILLAGACTVDEAEPLLQLLAADPARVVDWSGCDRLHTALVQVLLRMRPALRGACADPFVRQWIAPLLVGLDDRPGDRLDSQTPPSRPGSAEQM